MTVEPAPPGTLAERAYSVLEEMIVTLQLPPGSALSDAELSARLSIGRTPIREAIQRLAAAHLVEIVAHRAILVSRITIEEQILILETRRDLERLVARRAARLGTASERARLAELSGEMTAVAEDNDGVEFLRADAEFNELMATCSRNPFATRALAPLYALSRRFWFARHGEADLVASAKVHVDLMTAIIDQDEERAATASDGVLDYALAFLRSSSP